MARKKSVIEIKFDESIGPGFTYSVRLSKNDELSIDVGKLTGEVGMFARHLMAMKESGQLRLSRDRKRGD